MHWFDHFLTKLSKYLWIKTGDRHYHFVEPWVIDRPFCRMETVYQNHFVETGVGSLQNGAPQPPPGNGKKDYNIFILYIIYIQIHVVFLGQLSVISWTCAEPAAPKSQLLPNKHQDVANYVYKADKW